MRERGRNVRPARQLLADATAQLTTAGVASPRVDAELLLAALLDVPRTQLMTGGDIPESVASAFDANVTRRVGREPLQHITAHAPFRHVEVAVGAGVFVPRPETELLVDAVLPHLAALAKPTVVDLCAGSGALGLAIADELPTASVVAVERSLAAARWLGDNASGTRVRVVVGDIADPDLLRAYYGQADAVVCNPPYVPEQTKVEPEVLADPTDAVFAGADGLAVIPVVISRAALLLASGGVLAMEHDETQGATVPALLEKDGRWRDIADHRDLTTRPRYVVATRR